MRIATFSTYPPRACGIGTFAFDVRTALLAVPGMDEVSPIAIVDEPSSPQRPEILAHRLPGHARRLRARRPDARPASTSTSSCSSTSTGSSAARDGEYVLSFAQELAQPLVVTLHTVLSEPSPHQLQVLTALCDEAERVIVMTETARRLLD